MSQVVRLSMSIERPLLDKLEKLVQDRGYTNRSEFLRDMIRDRLVQEQWAGKGESLGTVTLVYDHHARGLSDQLTHLQHHFRGKVLATTHIHLDEKHCAEMIMMRGKAVDITALVDRMRQKKGVLHVQLAISTTAQTLA